MSNKITGNIGPAGTTATITYTATKGAPPSTSHSVAADASGNHTSLPLPAGSFRVTATDPAGLLRYNTFDVIIDGVNDVSGVNLRSSAKNASNAQEGGF